MSVKRKVTVPDGRSLRTQRSSARQDPASSHTQPQGSCSLLMGREAGLVRWGEGGGGSVSPLRSAVVWAPKEVVQAVATGLGCLRFWRAASSLIDSARISMALNAAAAPMPKSLH